MTTLRRLIAFVVPVMDPGITVILDPVSGLIPMPMVSGPRIIMVHLVVAFDLVPAVPMTMGSLVDVTVPFDCVMVFGSVAVVTEMLATGLSRSTRESDP